MFCSKCGTQLSEMDAVCPKCGTKNINYSALSKKPAMSIKMKSNREKILPNSKRLVFFLGVIIVISIVVAILAGVFIWNNLVSKKDHISYTNRGLSGYLDNDGNAYFIDGTEMISFPGVATEARTTPDHTKYLVLCEDNRLVFYTTSDDSGKVVSNYAKDIQVCNDQGFFYLTKSEMLDYYDFSSSENIELGIENIEDRCFSSTNTAVAILDADGGLYTYVTGDDLPKELCSTDENADILCVADDGSNVIWSVKSGNSYSVYMIENGVPERIGKVNNTEKYSYIYGDFFNNGNSFLIYSYGGAQVILGHDKSVMEISLPGVLAYNRICSANGKYVDSDDDELQTFYLSVCKSSSSSTETLYQLTLDGDLTTAVEGINADASYGLSNGYLYYINPDKDLVRTKLGDSTSYERITTDVDSLYLSANGTYLYIIKTGSLYVGATTDKTIQLEMITSKFTDESKLYLTNQDNVIYYIIDMQSISSYRYIGTAYRYTVGEPAVELSRNILYFYLNDKEYVDADEPLIVKYRSTNNSSDIIVDYGSIVDGEYQSLLSQVTY